MSDHCNALLAIMETLALMIEEREKNSSIPIQLRSASEELREAEALLDGRDCD